MFFRLLDGEDFSRRHRRQMYERFLPPERPKDKAEGPSPGINLETQTWPQTSLKCSAT